MATSGRPIDVMKPSAEKTNYIRLARLLMCGGTTIVRGVFDSIIPPSQLPKMLKEQTVFTRLQQMKKNKLLFSFQWKVLFPSPGTYGKSESFDITLLFKLLREFSGLTEPQNGWDELPDDNDNSMSADLVRIKYLRNELSHCQEDLGISDGEFITYWELIKGAFLRLVQNSPSLGTPKDWEKKIDELLTGPVTDDDERNIEELESWYRQDQDVKEMFNKIIKLLESMQPPSKESEDNCGTQGSELVEFSPYSAQDIEPLSIQGFAEGVDLQDLVEELYPYKTSVRDPPPDQVKKCRNICQLFKGEERKILIKNLRKWVPSGTTGPLEEENKLYEHLDAKKKEDLTRALCGPEVLRRLLCEFGKSNSLPFYDRQRNPVESLLEEECKKRALTIGELYDVLVKCEASVVADDYL